MKQKVSKFNIIYFSTIVLLPLLLSVALIFAGWYYWILELLITGGVIFLLYHCFGFGIIAKIQRRINEKKLNEMGFVQNYAYNEKTSNLYIDVNSGKIAMFFFFNPQIQFVEPESLSNFKVRDFKSGVGVFAGTKCVAFDFKIENHRFRFRTFTSNARWKMDSNYVVDAIEEAEEVIYFFENPRPETEDKDKAKLEMLSKAGKNADITNNEDLEQEKAESTTEKASEETAKASASTEPNEETTEESAKPDDATTATATAELATDDAVTEEITAEEASEEVAEKETTTDENITEVESATEIAKNTDIKTGEQATNASNLEESENIAENLETEEEKAIVS